MNSRLLVVFLTVILYCVGARAATDEPLAEPRGSLSLAEARALALLGNPALRAMEWEIRAAEARRRAVEAYPNPELGLAVENGPGSGELRGFDVSEQTLEVSQLFELGGKRRHRVAASSREQDLARWDYEAVRLDLLTEVARGFYAIEAAQARVALAAEDIRISEEVLSTAQQRVVSGIAPADEEMKARLAVSLSRIERQRAEQNLNAAKLRLAASWGSRTATFDDVQDGLDSLSALPELEEVMAEAEANPDVARWSAELELREVVLKLERAGRVPDLTLSAGVRRFQENGDVAMVMGASLPLPLFNGNAGNIGAAQAEVTKGLHERQAAEARVRVEIAEAYRDLSTARREAITLREDILPEAQRVFEAADSRYHQGKSSYLEVLDAQRTVYEARGRYVDALESWHTARAELERRIGMSLDDANAPGKTK